MNFRLAIAAIASATLVVALYFVFPADLLVKKYVGVLRPLLFTCFFGACVYFLNFKQQFLVSLKTNIIESPAYKARYERLLTTGEKLEFYKPFENLDHFINLCVYSSALAALAQITFGLAEYRWSILVCLYTATFSAVMLGAAFLIHRKIMKEWNRMSKIYQKKLFQHPVSESN